MKTAKNMDDSSQIGVPSMKMAENVDGAKDNS